MERMVKDFEEVREALGIKSWLTLGHSFVGLLQMGYVEQYPNAVKGMLMINCTLCIKESMCDAWIPKAYEFLGMKNDFSCPVDDTAIGVVKNKLNELGGKLNEQGVRWKMGYANQENSKKMDSTFEEIPNWNWDFGRVAFNIKDYWKDYRKDCSKIKVPVLFFSGKYDCMAGNKNYIGVNFPNMLLWKSDVGHMPFQENKEDLDKAIETFIHKYKFTHQ
jgi:proline iminopeptidase